MPLGRLARKAREEPAVNLVLPALWDHLERGCVAPPHPPVRCCSPKSPPTTSFLLLLFLHRVLLAIAASPGRMGSLDPRWDIGVMGGGQSRGVTTP